MLITSYESMVAYGESLKGMVIDLLVCDEGHRLKNVNTKQYRVLSSLHSKKRILITGTPIQNNLMELFACATFVIPDLFKNEKCFRKVYADPIEKGLAKGAFSRDVELSKVRSKELSDTLSSFMIRRTQKILEKYLPPRYEYHVYLKPTDLQQAMYNKCITLRQSKLCEANGVGDIFTLTTILRKILTHPLLINSMEDDCCEDMKKYVAASREASTAAQSTPLDQPELSSCKFAFISGLLEGTTKDSKLIVVSYFTTTLDMIGNWLDLRDCKYCRLDGSMSVKERQKQLNRFKNPADGFNVFLLGAKAGGVGLNIVAANRMVMVDLDWNPSNDAQVMGRVYRKGQTRPVYIYRLIAAGTVEEKVLERQFSKQDLSDAMESADLYQRFTPEELKSLFKPCTAAVGKHVLKKQNSSKQMLSKDQHLMKLADSIRYVVIANRDEEQLSRADGEDSDTEEAATSEGKAESRLSGRAPSSSTICHQSTDRQIDDADQPSDIREETTDAAPTHLAERNIEVEQPFTISKTSISKRSTPSENEHILEIFKQCLE